MKSQKVKISDLKFDPEIYPRMGWRWETRYKYAQAIRSGSVFPPIMVGNYKGELYIYDGKHRVEAFKLLKLKKIEATIKKFNSKQEMFIQAIQLNNIHGKPLSAQDKARLLYKLNEIKRPKSEISRLLKIPDDKFDVFLKRVIKINGKIIILKKPVLDSIERCHLKEEDIKEKLNEIDQSSFQTRKIDNLLDQLIELLQVGIYPIDDDKIHPKTVKLYKLLGETLG